MNINQDISQRITILRFPLIVGIVFIHASGTATNFSDGTIGLDTIPYLVSFVQNLISNVLARITVPMFFLISGFLFFKNFELTYSVIKQKFQTRIKTLLIPYILWNLCALLLYFVLQSIPSLSPFFSGHSKYIIDYELYDYLNAFLAFHKTANFPTVYQFWFIRDLMLLVLLAPVFWLIADKIPIFGLLSFFSLWFFNPKISFLNLSLYAVFFFYLGAFISTANFQLNRIDLYGKWIIFFYLAMALLDAIFLTENILLFNGRFYSRLTIIPGILAVWYLTGKITQSVTLKNLLIKLSVSSFFVYAIHEPFLLAGLKKIIYRIATPSNSPMIISIYLIAPLITIAIALLLDRAINKTMPVLYKVITGNR